MPDLHMRTIWFIRLPTKIQTSLACRPELDLEAAAASADSITEVVSPPALTSIAQPKDQRRTFKPRRWAHTPGGETPRWQKPPPLQNNRFTLSICSLLSINVTKSFTFLLFVGTTCFGLTAIFRWYSSLYRSWCSVMPFVSMPCAPADCLFIVSVGL
jgi:hypothetical protein